MGRRPPMTACVPRIVIPILRFRERGCFRAWLFCSSISDELIACIPIGSCEPGIVSVVEGQQFPAAVSRALSRVVLIREQTINVVELRVRQKSTHKTI
jgi:hypothetical protein